MNKVIVLAGPTAVGKTKFSLAIAKEFNCEIVGCDSMQLYKYMDIGSAKPTPEEMAMVKHHLVDCVDPKSIFSVAKYQKKALEAIDQILSEGKTPLVTGGTGLYLNSIMYKMDFAGTTINPKLRKELEEEAAKYGNMYVHNKLEYLDPKTAARIHPNNLKKTIRAIETIMAGRKIKAFQQCYEKNDKYEFLLIGITREREELYSRIDDRVEELIDVGLIEEVEALYDMGLNSSYTSMKGIGYKELMDHLEGKTGLNDAIRLIKRNTRHYAKRQMTWFKRYEDMKWFDLSEYESDEKAIEEIIEWIKINA